MAEFNYFDQFKEIEIDLTQYLLNLSVSGQKYTFSNIQPVKTTVKNLFTKYDIIFDYRNNLDLIFKYNVDDNEFIETTSYKNYGTTEFWWIIALFNNIKDQFKDWPLSQKQLIETAKMLYEKERKYSYQTYINFLKEDNDKKKVLTLPKSDTIKDIIWKYRQVLLNEQ